jgi:hypothetical protein
MKKIVISALLAGLVSTASAQAVISGVVNYDYAKAQASAATTGLADSQINLVATETISGGIKVTAGVGLNGAGRGETVSGNDAYVSIAAPVGTVTVGQLEVANGLKANTFGLAPIQGADGVVLGAKSNLDVVKYVSPAIGGFSASVNSVRAVDGTGERTNVFGVAGKVAMFNTTVDYTDETKRVRASASTTVAGLTVGAGVSRQETGVADSWVVAAAMPVGPVTVGAAYSDGNGKAKEVGVQYNLSKRTAVQVAYRDVTENTTAANNVSKTRVRLSHLF